MRINVRRVTRHRRVVEIVLIRSNNEVASSEPDLLRAARNVVPCVARFCGLVVPSTGLHWWTSRYQRTFCSPRLVNGLVDLVNLEGISRIKIQAAKDAS